MVSAINVLKIQSLYLVALCKARCAHLLVCRVMSLKVIVSMSHIT